MTTTPGGTDAATRWDARYASMSGPVGAPCPLLLESASALRVAGRALDVAGGRGRHALWLATGGLDTTLLDVSAVGLASAAAAARLRGLPLRTLRRDLERVPELPPGPWDVIVWSNYLHRALLPAVGGVLAPGGLLVLAHPTRRNLERHARPSARFLLEEGELPGLLPGLELLRHEEAWTEAGRHEAWVLARRAG